MCILLKFDYAKFGVSNLFFSKVFEGKPFGGWGGGGGRLVVSIHLIISYVTFYFRNGLLIKKIFQYN